MRKISSWFDSLPLKRKSKSRSSKKCTENAESDFLFLPKKQKLRPSLPRNRPGLSGHNPVDCKGTNAILEAEPRPAVSCPDQEAPFGSYHTLPVNRPQIRTNPWYSCQRPVPPLSLYASIQRSRPSEKPQIALDQSVCSSGYGSHDSSPESSVHSPDWPQDGHTPRSEKAIVCTETDLDEAFESGEECEDCRAVLDSNGNKRQSPPQFHAPPPPPVAPSDSSQVLYELSIKMKVLREKSDILKATVNRAKEERLRRFKERQVCMEQVRTIKQLKWVVRKNFELVL